MKVDTEKDERDALVQRTADERVDRTIMSAEQASAVFANLAGSAPRGSIADALAYHDLGALRVTIGWEHESKPGTEVVATLEPNGSPVAVPRHQGCASSYAAGGRSSSGTRRSRRPRPTSILAKMSAFKEATVYKVGESYLGKDVWAMDLMPPVDGVALVAGQADDDEADHRLFGAAARERSVVHQPRAEDGRAAADRSRCIARS